MSLFFIDNLAWFLIRLAGLLQSYLGELIWQFYKPNPCDRNGYEHFQLLTSMVFGGMVVFHARSPADLPRAVTEKLLFQGRIMLVLITICLVWQLK